MATAVGKLAWRNLWRRKRRTLITAFSIAFGVLLAFGAKGSPAVVMSIVFAGAPVVNAAVSLWVLPPAGGWQSIRWQFLAGILMGAMGLGFAVVSPVMLLIDVVPFVAMLGTGLGLGIPGFIMLGVGRSKVKEWDPALIKPHFN